MINDLLQYIHIFAAVTGLGVAFGFSILLRIARSVTEAKHTLQLFDRFGFIPHIGSAVLLATSVIMVIQEPMLLSKVWFTTSIAAYILVQGYVAGKLPKLMRALSNILETHTEEGFPESYWSTAQKAIPLERTTQLLSVILLLLLVFKP